MDKKAFIDQIAGYVCRYAPDYDILVPSVVIAQAILESGWGESRLAAEYHNYFGLKCGTLWKGRSVNMQTQEEYSPRTLTTTSDNFRVYDSMEEGVNGYFEFLQLPRYQNLRGITDPRKYLETIKADGYATSSAYVSSCMNLVEQYGLTKYDTMVPDPEVTAEDVLDVFRSWIGLNAYDGSYREIIDLYNSHTPRARGYAVQYSDAWCDATVCAAFIKLGAVDLIGGTECGVENHVQLFKAAGIWIEDGSITPEPGDIIVYNWDQASQPNDGYADHIGIVESVGGGKIVTIEGNYGNAVKRRVLNVGNGNIRGYARPKYAQGSAGNAQKPEENVQKPAGNAQGPNKVPKWVGKVTADWLNVRTWAGMENPNIKNYPILARGNLVDVCDTVYAADGDAWYYVRIAGEWYGFVHSDYISKV